MWAMSFKLHRPSIYRDQESHTSDGKMCRVVRTVSAQTVIANTWLQSALVVGSVWVHIGWFKPPLTKNETWPRESWSPRKLPSVWTDSTSWASAALNVPSVTPVIGPRFSGSKPVNRPMMWRRFDRVWTWREERAIICAPRPKPTRFTKPEL